MIYIWGIRAYGHKLLRSSFVRWLSEQEDRIKIQIGTSRHKPEGILLGFSKFIGAPPRTLIAATPA